MNFTSGVYRTEFDPSSGEASLALIDAIADAENADAAEIFEDGAPLYEYLDPDALDRLLTSPSVDEISLTIDGNHIQIHSNGTIDIQD
jgi:hypothetical protein